MKLDQLQEAKDLYFQTDMTKSEIAGKVGVSRRTILRWCKEDDWERLRQSTRVLPAIITEKCYLVLDNILTRMVDESAYLPVTLKEAETAHLLAATIKKLKNRSTVNESMELFNFFLEGLKKKNPQLAEDIRPEMEEYIAKRAKEQVVDFFPEELKKDPDPDPNALDKAQAEKWADEKDLEVLRQEIKITGNYEQAVANWEKGITQNPGEVSPAQNDAPHNSPSIT